MSNETARPVSGQAGARAGWAASWRRLPPASLQERPVPARWSSHPAGVALGRGPPGRERGLAVVDGQEVGGRFGVADRGQSVVPVSYTHLTLPTIYSV